MPNKKSMRNNNRKTKKTAPEGDVITSSDKYLKHLGQVNALAGRSGLCSSMSQRQIKEHLAEYQTRTKISKDLDQPVLAPGIFGKDDKHSHNIKVKKRKRPHGKSHNRGRGRCSFKEQQPRDDAPIGYFTNDNHPGVQFSWDELPPGSIVIMVDD